GIVSTASAAKTAEDVAMAAPAARNRTFFMMFLLARLRATDVFLIKPWLIYSRFPKWGNHSLLAGRPEVDDGDRTSAGGRRARKSRPFAVQDTSLWRICITGDAARLLKDCLPALRDPPISGGKGRWLCGPEECFMFTFDNSYARLPERFYASVYPEPVEGPVLVKFNEALAVELRIDADLGDPQRLAAVLAG